MSHIASPWGYFSVFCLSCLQSIGFRSQGGSAVHGFGPLSADIRWSHAADSLRHVSLLHVDEPLRILHITDSHISLHDDDPPHTTRMFNAFAHTTDHETKSATTPREEFLGLLRLAHNQRVDLIALGGDIVNSPSHETVDWVVQNLRQTGIPFIYTAGNHDWLAEGVVADDPTYDYARPVQLNSILRPFFENSMTSKNVGVSLVQTFQNSSDVGIGKLYGLTTLKGTDVMFIDNSNHQVNEEQLLFAREQLADHSRRGTPVVLLLHMPLALPGLELEPKYVCGHPQWGAAMDENWSTEGRPKWPVEGNAPSTRAFIDLVQSHAAPSGRIVALLTGHVHKDFSASLQDHRLPAVANLTVLACGSHLPGCGVHEGGSGANGALQYITLDAAEGGYRLLTIQRPAPRSREIVQETHGGLVPFRQKSLQH